MDHQVLRDWCAKPVGNWIAIECRNVLDERDALERRVKELETVNHIVESDEPRCLDNFRLFLEDRPPWTGEIIISILDAHQILGYIAKLRQQRKDGTP